MKGHKFREPKVNEVQAPSASDSVVRSCRFPSRLLERLNAEAKRTDRSFNNLVMHFCQTMLRQQDERLSKKSAKKVPNKLGKAR